MKLDLAPRDLFLVIQVVLVWHLKKVDESLRELAEKNDD
jgi:hypothetical protein